MGLLSEKKKKKCTEFKMRVSMMHSVRGKMKETAEPTVML